MGSRCGLDLANAVAVVWAGSYSFDSTPSLGTSICRRCGPKKQKEKKNQLNKYRGIICTRGNMLTFKYIEIYFLLFSNPQPVGVTNMALKCIALCYYDIVISAKIEVFTKFRV